MAAYPDAFSNDHPCKCILDVIEIAIQYCNAYILAYNYYIAKFNMLQAIECFATSTDEEKKTAWGDCENARVVSDECDSIYRQGVATTLSLSRTYDDVMNDAASLVEAFDYIIENYKH